MKQIWAYSFSVKFANEKNIPEEKVIDFNFVKTHEPSGLERLLIRWWPSRSFEIRTVDDCSNKGPSPVIKH